MPKRTYPDQAGLQYRGLGDGLRCMRGIIPDSNNVGRLFFNLLCRIDIFFAIQETPCHADDQTHKTSA